MACEGITIETTALDEVIEVGVVGPQGPSGAAGVGVPTGGITGYVLAKASTADYDTEWVAQTGGGGNFSSPPPIGDVTPNTGAFTNLSAVTGSITTISAGQLTAVTGNFTTISASGIATLPHIHGSLAGNLYIHVKNTSGGALSRGTPVYITGNVGATDRVEVAAADFDDPAKMPAVGLLEQDLAQNGTGDAIILGELDSANTAAYSLHQELFVGNNGTLTGAAPITGEVQSVGIVSRVQSNTGVIVVNMQARHIPIAGVGSVEVYENIGNILSDYTFPSRRNARYSFRNISGGSINLFLPSNYKAGDVVILQAIGGGQTSNVIQADGVTLLTTITTIQRKTFLASATGWFQVDIDSHTHGGADIISGTISSDRLAVGVVGNAVFGTALIQGKGDLLVGAGTDYISLVTVGANGQVLTADSTATAGVSWATASGGVTGAASSASDVLGVSGANITGVDAGSDKIVFWDDSASKLAYLEAGSGLSLSGTTLSATATGTIGGSTGATDNLLLRSDGTGGQTLQNSALQLDDAVTGGTQSNVALINAHSETNSALVLTPKGNGAFIVGPKPDGTTTGGNARGTNSIDIQLTRTAANQVASGTTSVAIGVNSRASSTNSIAIGNFAAASNSPSVAIGQSSTASGESSVAIGENCSAGGLRAVGIGRTADANLRGMLSTIPFNAIYWSGQTTNNTATVLGLDGGAGVRFTIAASTALAVDILLVARRATTQDKWLVARRFLGIRRDGSNNTALIGAVQTLGTDQSAGTPTWTFALTADDTNEALQLQVTGETGETVEWRATAFYRVA